MTQFNTILPPSMINGIVRVSKVLISKTFLCMSSRDLTSCFFDKKFKKANMLFGLMNPLVLVHEGLGNVDGFSNFLTDCLSRKTHTNVLNKVRNIIEITSIIYTYIK